MTRSVGTMNMARVKQLDLVRFIHDRYGVSFAKCGERYVCRSPLTNEKAPSFYVWRAPDGHWVFKCFSSGCSGSIVDFVMAREGCPTASAALSWINKEYGAMPLLTFEDVQPQQIATSKKEIDLEYLHKQFRDNDNEIVSIWLRKRGIADELASTLVCEKIAVHNRYKDKSYCCFAVRDHAGTLVCLDNHEIGGQEKFVLGRRTFFSLDHDKLDHAESVCVCEGIIDYLSVKTLMGIDTVGVALLGSDVGVLSPDQFPSARLVLSALDSDTAGARALLDLETLYPEKELSVFQMDDDCKDPNECLQKVTRGEKQVSLSASDKAQLYRDFCSSSNKTDVALRWGINRSYMYEIAAECEKMIVAGFENRRPGRKPSSAQSLSTLSEAHTRIKELENKIADEEKERQKWYARSKFLGVRLKYSEEEVAELRGQEMPRCVDMDTPARIPRHHVKKKEKIEALSTMKQLLMELPTVGKVTLIKLMPYSTTQVYLWEKGVEDRKIREPQGMVDNNCLQNAVNLIRALPHLGAAKGQAYMIYHRLGYIPQHVYKTLKKMVRRLTNQEVQQRDLLGEKQSFEHVVTSEPDEIWAEDFTELPVEKKVFKLAVVIDVHTNYYLGISVGLRATTALVEGPVTQAVAVNKGKGPSAFMLSDNGKQYISDQHEQKLDSLAIVHRRIPACKPQYNGSVECGIKEIKNVFYSLWARRRENKQEADEKKTLTQLVQEVAFETQRAMNEEIPRPCLSGITAYDAYTGRAEEQIGACQQYIEQETVKRKEGAQWGALDWSKVKRQLFNPNMSNIKLMTTFCQLLKRPLRMLAKIHKGVLGNYEKIFFGFS